MPTNRSWKLAARPQGAIKDTDFTWSEEPAPDASQLAEGQVLVRTLYLSVDPTQRGWMERDTYLPAVRIGDVMRAGGLGRVIASKSPAFSVDDLVSATTNWQDYVVLPSTGPSAPIKLPKGVDPKNAMSALGITGATAYFGLLDVGKAKEGETVVVSAAAGATGMMVAQIAKLKGCRVVGIAGGPDKCRYLTAELGLDGAVDYRSDDVRAKLRELCPKGIDVYFDNVGGDILDAALANLAMRARVVLCGAIAQYNDADGGATRGPKNYMNLLIKRARMEGFIILDYFPRFPEAMKDLATWLAQGKLKDKVDVVEGIENAPRALRGLFAGENLGKRIVKVSD